eukprot:TRINITY_DN198_c1_g3_i1.p1 TRINITY_DN198_c1_g3~~TRINITY_DN198_c1_g3_i1.p1  ORF type:complete len:141 (-),score=2.90 TRINITY_DN198_c1_g3_i1:376-798(-)
MLYYSSITLVEAILNSPAPFARMENLASVNNGNGELQEKSSILVSHSRSLPLSLSLFYLRNGPLALYLQTRRLVCEESCPSAFPFLKKEKDKKKHNKKPCQEAQTSELARRVRRGTPFVIIYVNLPPTGQTACMGGVLGP